MSNINIVWLINQPKYIDSNENKETAQNDNMKWPKIYSFIPTIRNIKNEPGTHAQSQQSYSQECTMETEFFFLFFILIETKYDRMVLFCALLVDSFDKMEFLAD